MISPSYDIVCFYADIGRDYEPLLTRMTKSAKAKMPKARLICATPTPEGRIGQNWDHIVPLPKTINVRNLCLERARFTISWMLHADRPALLVDPDIEFLREIPMEGLEEINFFTRKGKIDQPINGGMMICKPGPKEFWFHYGRITVNLPDVLHAWWCDQLALNLMIGACERAPAVLRRDDATVKLLDGKELCPNSDAKTISPAAWAIHYKGARKGPGWDKVYLPKEKSGDGKSLPVFALSTDSARAQNSGSRREGSPSIFVPISPIST